MEKPLFAFAFATLLLAGCETRNEASETTETTGIEQETVMPDSLNNELNSPVTEIEAATENVDSLLNEI